MLGIVLNTKFWSKLKYNKLMGFILVGEQHGVADVLLDNEAKCVWVVCSKYPSLHSPLQKYASNDVGATTKCHPKFVKFTVKG